MLGSKPEFPLHDVQAVAGHPGQKLGPAGGRLHDVVLKEITHADEQLVGPRHVQIPER